MKRTVPLALWALSGGFTMFSGRELLYTGTDFLTIAYHDWEWFCK
ncbi:hypothetical protein VCHA53O466_50156 [Vibrio chagasii]|nr:hypothetical protein VCHA53O466_50156 [Vibrio chagasii]